MCNCTNAKGFSKNYGAIVDVLYYEVSRDRKKTDLGVKKMNEENESSMTQVKIHDTIHTL